MWDVERLELERSKNEAEKKYDEVNEQVSRFSICLSTSLQLSLVKVLDF